MLCTRSAAEISLYACPEVEVWSRILATRIPDSGARRGGARRRSCGKLGLRRWVRPRRGAAPRRVTWRGHAEYSSAWCPVCTVGVSTCVRVIYSAKMRVYLWWLTDPADGRPLEKAAPALPQVSAQRRSYSERVKDSPGLRRLHHLLVRE